MRRLIISAGLTAMLAGVAPVLAEPSVVVLGGGHGDDPVAACGALASSPYEPARVGPGLADEAVFLDGALAACEAALAAAPNSIEAQTWLGRVYILTGRPVDAQPLLEAAVSGGSGFAAYLLSDAISRGAIASSDPERSRSLLQQAADAGYLPAMAKLAEVFEMAADYLSAFDLYIAASTQGLGLASYRLGYFYHAGYGVDFDYESAMSFYQKAAGQGEPLGHYGVGQLYEFGQGVAQDYAMAAENYRLGADRKEKFSETALAYLYEQGLGVERDYDQSFALLLDAAAQNHGFGQAALSIHYLFGQGTAVDYAKALDLAWAAQRQGVVYANGVLGYIYAEGLGVPRNLGTARFQYDMGAQGGDQFSADSLPAIDTQIACQEEAGSPDELESGGRGKAMLADIDPATAIPACEAALGVNDVAIGNKVWLGRAYLADGNTTDALPLLTAGISAGNPLAQFTYAAMLAAGTGVNADPMSAIPLYESAAGQEFGPAMLALGDAYAEGLGVTADLALARQWYDKAVENGQGEAEFRLAALDAGQVQDGIDLAGFGREGPGY